MCFANHRDGSNIRGEELAEFANPPLLVHAHFSDEDACANHQVLVDRSGESHHVVKARRRGDRLVGFAHNLGNITLSRGFAVGPGDGDNLRSYALELASGLHNELVREPALDLPQHSKGEIGEVCTEEQGYNNTSWPHEPHSQRTGQHLQHQDASIDTLGSRRPLQCAGGSLQG